MNKQLEQQRLELEEKRAAFEKEKEAFEMISRDIDVMRASTLDPSNSRE